MADVGWRQLPTKATQLTDNDLASPVMGSEMREEGLHKVRQASTVPLGHHGIVCQRRAKSAVGQIVDRFDARIQASSC